MYSDYLNCVAGQVSRKIAMWRHKNKGDERRGWKEKRWIITYLWRHMADFWDTLSHSINAEVTGSLNVFISYKISQVSQQFSWKFYEV